MISEFFFLILIFRFLAIFKYTYGVIVFGHNIQHGIGKHVKKLYISMLNCNLLYKLYSFNSMGNCLIYIFVIYNDVMKDSK